jgi:hypothetical protein
MHSQKSTGSENEYRKYGLNIRNGSYRTYNKQCKYNNKKIDLFIHRTN